MTPDQIVLAQARKRLINHIEKKGKTPDGWAYHGPGATRKGSVFDCNREYFERLLKTYFSELFLGWNPFKNDGNGCWEVWQKPLSKVSIYIGKLNGESLYTIEPKPLSDMEHHVYDLPFLTPAFIDKLREMDTWEQKDFFKEADYEQDQIEDKLDKKEEENIKYVVRHHKDLFRQLKGLAEHGYNPFWFFSDKRQGDGQV